MFLPSENMADIPIGTLDSAGYVYNRIQFISSHTVKTDCRCGKFTLIGCIPSLATIFNFPVILCYRNKPSTEEKF